MIVDWQIWYSPESDGIVLVNDFNQFIFNDNGGALIPGNSKKLLLASGYKFIGIL